MSTPIRAHELTFTAIRHHRNGVGGASFYVVRFTFRDADEDDVSQLQAVVFETEGHCAVTCADHTSTWRGDQFEPHIRAFIASEAAQHQAFAA